MLFEFKPLLQADLELLLERVRLKLDFSIDEEAKSYLLRSSNQDARALLNLLEYALVLDEKQVSLENLKRLRASALSKGAGDKDVHFKLASSLIKSLRGSDVDAALYYLAALIEGGRVLILSLEGL